MEPVKRPRSEHNISRKNIDPDALKVLYRLHNSGYAAYLVGGGVRDMLVSLRPKDFDVATNAHPQEIRKLFRNARLIGRRFRLAHVVFGPKIIEVSTFRKKSEYVNEDAGDLLIRRDNTFGSAEEDALRRDFTVNGLFYDIGSFALIDYVGGLDDIDMRLIRAIGEPAIRFREDPIRILRAVKFAARLSFDLEPTTRAAMVSERWELPKAAPPRILEEHVRMLRGGAARRSYQILRELGVFEVVLPRIEQFLASTEEAVFTDRMRFWEYLEVLDELRQEGRELTNAVLVGCLLVHPIRAAAQARGLDLENPTHVEELLQPLAAGIHLPRREMERLKMMMMLLPRLQQGPHARSRVQSIVSRLHFPESLTLLEIEATATGEGAEQVQAWRDLAGKSPQVERLGSRRRRRGRRRRTGEGDLAQEEAPEGQPTE